jgi:hypothetical protein
VVRKHPNHPWGGRRATQKLLGGLRPPLGHGLAASHPRSSSLATLSHPRCGSSVTSRVARYRPVAKGWPAVLGAHRPPHGWLGWSRATLCGRQREKRLSAMVSAAVMAAASRCSNLGEIIWCFVLIFIFCNFLKLLMYQLRSGWQKTLVFCNLRIVAALYLYFISH